jgi:hypothetical protein
VAAMTGARWALLVLMAVCTLAASGVQGDHAECGFGGQGGGEADRLMHNLSGASIASCEKPTPHGAAAVDSASCWQQLGQASRPVQPIH